MGCGEVILVGGGDWVVVILLGVVIGGVGLQTISFKELQNTGTRKNKKVTDNHSDRIHVTSIFSCVSRLTNILTET